jgi:phage terminase large subunit
LQLLTPTIRKDWSELWFSWNPDKETDAVDVLFEKNAPKDSMLIHVNYLDNPFCPQVLIDEAANDREYDYELYCHKWLGGYNTKSEAMIFKGYWEVLEYDIDYTFGYPIQGMDFGFSQDPTAAVRLYIKNDDLYISHEYGRTHLDINDTAKEFKKNIANFDKYPLYADSARPESISYLKKHGLPKIEGVKKWPGSVEDGIAHMKSFNMIYIHPRCVKTAQEFKNYCYKIDKNTGEITDSIIDKHNHFIDAGRYALNKRIIKGRPINYKSIVNS